MKNVTLEFFGDSVLWKDGEQEAYRKKVERGQYVQKEVREKKAAKERAKAAEKKFAKIIASQEERKSRLP